MRESGQFSKIAQFVLLYSFRIKMHTFSIHAANILKTKSNFTVLPMEIICLPFYFRTYKNIRLSCFRHNNMCDIMHIAP